MGCSATAVTFQPFVLIASAVVLPIATSCDKVEIFLLLYVTSLAQEFAVSYGYQTLKQEGKGLGLPFPGNMYVDTHEKFRFFFCSLITRSFYSHSKQNERGLYLQVTYCLAIFFFLFSAMKLKLVWCRCTCISKCARHPGLNSSQRSLNRTCVKWSR